MKQRNQHYIGADDPHEGQRLATQDVGALEELNSALALHRSPADARVLELGCGNGTFTQALLAALPDATITAIDTNDGLLAQARDRLARESQDGRVGFLHADAARLPFSERSFDLVACRCLLMHQPDPLIVVGEMFRVAAIGAVALAIEPDWGARAFYPDSAAYLMLLDLARKAQPFGFPDLFFGRKLFAVLRAVGFSDIQVQATAFSETAQEYTNSISAIIASDGLPLTGPARLLEQGRTLLRQAGIADDATLDELIARLVAIRQHPEYFSAGMDFSASALKPAPTLP